MINADFRKTGPGFAPITSIVLPKAESYRLSNGIQVHEISGGTQEVIKFEIVFEAGRMHEVGKLASRVTAYLLKEGVKSKNSEEIAEFLDFYGTSVKTSAGMDRSKLVFYALIKHLEHILPLIAEILLEPTFPEDEYSSFIINAQNRLKMDLAKNELLGYRILTEELFGKDHPYGYNSSAEYYQDFDYNLVRQQYEQYYWTKSTKIFVSGLIDDHSRSLIDRYFGQTTLKQSKEGVTGHENISKVGRVHVPAPNKLQAAIRIGKKMFSRKHKDYPGIYFLGVVLGGYFGSRLMKNIREEKAYTYGIYAGMDTMRNDGYFYINTETATEYSDEVIGAIYNEIELLKSNPAPAEELSMVKNYIMGNYLSMLDGPLNSSRLLQTLILSDQPYEGFLKFVEEIRSIDGLKIQELANKYLTTKDFLEIVVIDN